MGSSAASADLVFFVNGKKNVVQNPEPELTLLQYLRSDLQLTGTKLGCGEGGCGACTVMVSFHSPDSDTTQHYSANACLLPLCSLHGMAVTTVEGIGSLRTRVHPVQERIAAAHGSQCGFCTPGFVMSMYTLLRNSPTPSDEQLDTVFEGNLCRCTGYRPILDAYRPFTKGGGCPLGAECCQNKNKTGVQNGHPPSNGVPVENGAVPNDTDELNGSSENGTKHTGVSYDPSQEPIFPPYLKLEGPTLHTQSLVFVGQRVRWYRPVSLAELLDIKKHNPDCKIVVGNTEIGVEVKFKKQQYPVLVTTTHIQELTSVQRLQSGIQLGASVTLATMDAALKDAIKELPEDKCRVFAAFVEMLRWFAGHQVRNVAAVGGNIMTASPISDLNPLLLACGATLTVVSTEGKQREVKMDHTFFKGYRQTAVLPNEILLSVLIPFSQKNEYFLGYKQANRKEDDISIVNAGMRVVLDDTAKVLDLSLAFGGMGPTTVMATTTMKQLQGLTWNEELLNKACELLTSDLPLDPGSPGGTTEYRRSLTVSFFFKFYLTVKQKLQQQAKPPVAAVRSSDRVATQPLERGPVKGFQWFEVSPESLSPNSALRLPVVHESAFKQATGEAQYTNDIAPRQGELYLGLVQSKKARAKLVRVDPSAALAMPGVVDYLSHTDVPGSNIWGLIEKDEEIFASKEVVLQGQVIGAILADTLANAQRAAQAVVVEYDVMEPIITIADAIQKKSFYPLNLLVSNGNVEEALSRAECVLEGELHVEAQEHFYLEPMVTIGYPTEDGGMELACSTQSIAFIQSAVAGALGLPFNKVKVRARRLGGAFGGKETRPAMHALPVAVAANKHNCPVRCTLERDEDMLMTGTRHPYLGKYRIGFSSAGKILAYDVKYYLNAGCALDLSYQVSEKSLIDSDQSYNIPNVRAEAHLCKTNIPSNTAFRGFGAPQANAIMETALTQVACHLNMAPDKLREMNLYKEGDVTFFKMVLTQCNLRRCWDDVKAQSKFEQRRKEVDLFNSENRWRKRGIAVTPTKFGLSFFEKFLNQGAALVNIYTDGTVLISHGGIEMGQGLHTKIMQVASQVLDVPLSKIQVDETMTNVLPNTTSTAASVSSDLHGAAVVDACNTLKQRLKPIQAEHPDYTWEQTIAAAHFEKVVSLSASGFYKPPGVGYNLKTGEGLPYLYFTFGSACSVVEVDCLTGDHQVISTDIVMDVGKSLSPAIDIGQIEGGFIQGYGLLMLEQYKVQGDGNLLTRGPGSYKIPAVGNIPQSFNVTLLRESGTTKAVYSSKGIGEPPMLLASSVLCAVYDAVRAARIDEGLNPFVPLNTPATPARIRMACSDRFTRLYEGAEKKSGKTHWFVDL
ncbi:xanthine dehydrogenase/oxidase-like isoform X1 [Littorina saxatilis]